MQHSVRSIDTVSWLDDKPRVVRNSSSQSYFRKFTSPQGKRDYDKTRKRRHTDRPNSFYRLSDGTTVTIEQLVLVYPLTRLFAAGVVEFSIDDIRMQVLFEQNLHLSWKQVRDALYRVNHGKLLFRHIGRGVYTWQPR